jgi:small-conductance mechanosensitive channel
LLENTVTNWALVDNFVRTSVRVGVAYGSDVPLVTRLLNEVALSYADVLLEPVHSVTFEDFGVSSLVFELNVWVHSKADRGLRMIRSDIRYTIDKLFRRDNVVIASPQRDMHADRQIFIRSESRVARALKGRILYW